MRCEIIQNEIIDEDKSVLNTYGIMFEDEFIVPDITTDFYQVNQLMEIFLTEDIELCHCMDVIYDFLCDKATICLKRK